MKPKTEEWSPLFRLDDDWTEVSLFSNGTLSLDDGSGPVWEFSKSETERFLEWLDNRPNRPPHPLVREVGFQIRRALAAEEEVARLRAALQVASAINTGQDCPDENHRIAVVAMDALQGSRE